MGVTGGAVRIDAPADGVLTITMADPASGNALGVTMVRALQEAFGQATADDQVRAIVLLGKGSTFSSGAPRDLLARFARGELKPTEIWLPKVLLDCPVPIIAAMSGHAVGGGFALGLAADLVLLAAECRYGFTFMNMGFTPGMGTTALAEHALSPAVAHELLYTGELRKGTAFAGACGVNAVLPASDVVPHALDLAARIAEKPRQSLELLKRTLSLPRRRAFETSITLESMMHQLTLTANRAERLAGACDVE